VIEKNFDEVTHSGIVVPGAMRQTANFPESTEYFSW